MHRIFSGNGSLVILSIRKSARDHCQSRLLVQQALVLLILCILCIHVNYEKISIAGEDCRPARISHWVCDLEKIAESQ